eukprot:2325317-Karenia_brevis.AAC.1
MFLHSPSDASLHDASDRTCLWNCGVNCQLQDSTQEGGSLTYFATSKVLSRRRLKSHECSLGTE